MLIRSHFWVAPLLSAAQLGHVEAAKIFLDQGADVNFTMDDNASPLYFACQQNHPEIAKLLLEKGADPNLLTEPNKIGALYIAASQNNLQCVLYLLEHGADIDIRRNTGSTPLACAARHGHLDILKALLVANADPDISENVPLPNPGANGETTLERWPLQLACGTNKMEVVEALIKAPKTPSFVHGDWNLLYHLVRNNRPDLLREAIKRGASTGQAHVFVSGPPQQAGAQAATYLNQNPFRKAIEDRNIECLRELALIPGEQIVEGRSYMCEFHCGFSGSYDEVTKHEPICPVGIKAKISEPTTAVAPPHDRVRRLGSDSSLEDGASDQESDCDETLDIFDCQYGCGFHGGYQEVLTHEKASLGNCCEAYFKEEPVRLLPLAGMDYLEIFRTVGVDYLAGSNEEVGQREPMGHYLNLAKDYSIFTTALPLEIQRLWKKPCVAMEWDFISLILLGLPLKK